MDNLWLIIIGMGIVTYLPRIFPLALLKDMKFPPFLKRFFEFVPYTILTSLIFPGILTSVEHIEAAVMGFITAILLSLFRVNIIVVVLGSIIAVYITNILL
ncbi:MAG: putative rane protein [Haloplasmataceae bacterium]|jgi:branched-subunit amino acid transport protein|nr:putative rane protein [Haloplasmataceae bacterium]